MTTITKERIELFIKNPLENGLTRGEQMELARIALASLERELIRHEHAKWSDSTFGCVGPHWSTETPLKRGSGSRSRTRRSQRVG